LRQLKVLNLTETGIVPLPVEGVVPHNLEITLGSALATSQILIAVTDPPASTLTNIFFLWNGSVVSYDWITATVP
jgi:hypothetical protein